MQLPPVPKLTPREEATFRASFSVVVDAAKADHPTWDPEAVPRYSAFAWKTLYSWKAPVIVRDMALNLAKVCACDRTVEHHDIVAAIRVVGRLARRAIEVCKKWP